MRKYDTYSIANSRNEFDGKHIGFSSAETIRQIDYVLGQWDKEEQEILSDRIDKCTKAVTSFALAGLANTMNTFNGK